MVSHVAERSNVGRAVNDSGRRAPAGSGPAEVCKQSRNEET